MNNLLIAPVVIPLLTGMALIILQKNIRLQRALSLIALCVTAIIAIMLINRISHGGIQTLQLGGWEAPFGISFVGDMFSALLLLATSIVAIGCVIFAFSSTERRQEKLYFYPLFLFLITGVNGSFLTGDLFNLYVFFEVFLVASYVMITLGGTQKQLRESLKYIFTNIISSAFFLMGVAYLYSITGTLNLAHLSMRIAEVGQDGLITTVALLFLIVFALKAGLLLFFWLPGSYSVPPTAVSAIFAALLTKVGIYAIFRMFTLIFYHEPQVTHLVIGILAAATMILGGLGAIGFWDLRNILTYNVIISVGFIMLGFVSMTTNGMMGSIYYLLHDMIIKALVFLIGGTIIHLTGTSRLKEIGGLIRLQPWLGWMFLIAALSMVGIPPLSGFLGKVFITRGAFESGYFWLGAIGLVASLCILYSMIKLFMNAFWGDTMLNEEELKGNAKGLLFPIAFLTCASLVLGIGAEGIAGYVTQAANELLNPNLYIQAVFK